MGGLVGERYRLESELGTGGTATVWLAHDVLLDRPVALKLLLDEPRAESRRERLHTEARALVALDHPRVVKVFDLGTHEGRDYIVMEYLERGSLADKLRIDGPLAPAEAVELLVQVLDALGAAHQAGIVHRDVKPGNVLIRTDGTAALCDFGIARTVDGGGDTRTGVALGSVGFMAPEQRVDARKAGPQADLYAAACTLYNLLTADTPVDLYLAQDSSPRWDAVPAPLRAVLRRATRSEPSARFQTAEEMADALRGVLPNLEGLPPARTLRLPATFGHPPTRDSVTDEPSLGAEKRDRAVDLEDWRWANASHKPVGRTAIWVGVVTTLFATAIFAAMGPLRQSLTLPVVPRAAADPRAALLAGAPELQGTWVGAIAGRRSELVLEGAPNALVGHVKIWRSRDDLDARRLHGEWSGDELVLTESTRVPVRYRARLAPSGRVLEGEVTRGSERQHFALVRVE